MQVSALTEHQTLHLCKFERSRTTKHYTCAGLSAREQPNTTPVQVRALTVHQTLHLRRFECSRTGNREHVSAHTKLIWIDGRRAKAHLSTLETHLDRRSAEAFSYCGIGLVNNLHSRMCQNIDALSMQKRVSLDARRANPNS